MTGHFGERYLRANSADQAEAAALRSGGSDPTPTQTECSPSAAVRTDGRRSIGPHQKHWRAGHTGDLTFGQGRIT
jgi:hypothetical protein